MQHDLGGVYSEGVQCSEGAGYTVGRGMVQICRLYVDVCCPLMGPAVLFCKSCTAADHQVQVAACGDRVHFQSRACEFSKALSKDMTTVKA